jgi:hypothetical protein
MRADVNPDQQQPEDEQQALKPSHDSHFQIVLLVVRTGQKTESLVIEQIDSTTTGFGTPTV